jgi:mannitol-1-phosphate 5-dehydrogenase
MEKLVQFGAGSIGRSFIGQLFARAGFEVVFVDVDDRIIEALNGRRQYRVEIRDDPPGELLVENVRAVNGRDRGAVVSELISARAAGTSVGAGALQHVYPVLAAGIMERQRRGLPPLDVILCENLKNAAKIVRAGLQACLPPDFPLESAVGLVETSIGKMVPLVPQAVREHDPLVVFAEAYNTLIVDAEAFKNPAPAAPGLEPRKNMAAYVDRKLYIHNLGHAAIAYHTALYHPTVQSIGDAIALDDVCELAGEAMRESAQALVRTYPDEFSEAALEAHIRDLVQRFGNPALGDTVYRVGRDIRRKLHRDDRIVGAMLIDLKHGVEPQITARVAAEAMRFRAGDEQGKPDPADVDFIRNDLPRGPEHVLSAVCGLDPADPIDSLARKLILSQVGSLPRAADSGG